MNPDHQQFGSYSQKPVCPKPSRPLLHVLWSLAGTREEIKSLCCCQPTSCLFFTRHKQYLLETKHSGEMDPSTTAREAFERAVHLNLTSPSRLFPHFSHLVPAISNSPEPARCPPLFLKKSRAGRLKQQRSP